MHKATAIPSDRFAQAFLTSRVFTLITAERAAAFGLPSSNERVRENHATHRLGGLNSLGEIPCPLDAELLQRPDESRDQRESEERL
jgi:hypothetical protein